ncbi:MAG: 2-polyprenyl-3-methyl-5-hydroxy-6-metoxy-1,4-benzoquinol methylase [Yoonia sp.]|jgi:2-polyprenyl-3-methyl-5-hydroxy-6-metoxy-1,4-benzoquinol methylase
MPLLKKGSALAFFDFFSKLPQYAGRNNQVSRLNKRFEFLIAGLLKDISGASVLDLGAHDDRWAYAFASAGAAEVTAIEARVDVAARLQYYPDAVLKAQVTMRVQDVFVGLEDAVRAGETYDMIAIYGLLYHVMDYFRLLDLLRQLDPKVIIIDSDFIKKMVH